MARTGSDRARAALCPCGSGTAYSRCCRPAHLGQDPPATAEALMRARYSAYAKRLPDYIVATWHPATRPDDIALDPRQRWTELVILRVEDGTELDEVGTVEFVARHSAGERTGELHEISRFERVDGAWSYVDGQFRS